MRALEDAGLLSTITGSTFLWHMLTIDPDIIAEVNQVTASVEIETSWDFVTRVAKDYLESKDPKGYLSNLVGHIGEQQAGERLLEAGHTVIPAETMTNPAWDYIVGGTYVDIKTVAHTRNAQFHHDDISYRVADDAAGPLPDNAERLEGLSHGDIHDPLQQAFDDATGKSAAELLELGGFVEIGGLPLATIAIVGTREVNAVRQGKSAAAAVEHGTMETVIKVGAVLAGAEIGRNLSEALGPVGALAGAMLGAGTGAVASAKPVKYAKQRRYRAAKRKLKRELAAYGSEYLDRRNELKQLAQQPLVAADHALARAEREARLTRKSPRWLLWPTLGQVTISETAALGRRRRGQIDKQVRETVQVIDAAPKSPELFGSMLLAIPDVLDAQGDHQRRKRILELAVEVRTEASYLGKSAAGTTPP